MRLVAVVLVVVRIALGLHLHRVRGAVHRRQHNASHRQNGEQDSGENRAESGQARSGKHEARKIYVLSLDVLPHASGARGRTDRRPAHWQAMTLRLLAALLLLGGCASDSTPEADASGATPELLAQAEAYLNTDRPRGAVRLLREVRSDDPTTRLLAARAEAGVGDWPRVLALLNGARGLDSLDSGRGLYLLARAHDDAGDPAAALAAYDAFLATPEAPESSLWRDAARLRRALVLVRESPEAGNRALDEIADVSSEWRGVLKAEALARSGDATMTETVASAYTRGALGRRAWDARIQAARASGDRNAARSLARQARASMDTDAARAHFARVAGDLAQEARDTGAARTLWREAIDADPGSRGAREAAARLREGSPEAADWLALARSERALGLNAEAAADFQKWLGAGEGTPAQQADVRYQAADALFDAQQYGEVEALLAPIMNQRRARELWAGTLSRMGRAPEAAAVYLALASGDAAPNLYFAADALQQGGDTEEALRLYRRVEREHAGTRWAGLATMRRAGQAFLEEDYAQAARLWDGYASRAPSGTHTLRSRYWAGRALAESGDARGAELRFRAVRREARDSYYALLASDALGEPFWPLAMGASPPENPEMAARMDDVLRGVDILREAGFPASADDELDRTIARTGGGEATRYALAEALVARGYGQRAIQVGQGLSGQNERRMRILYPFPFRRMITAEAEARGVGPFVAAALIRQESLFSARATSHVGARGLMQLMPATARPLAQAEGIADWDPEWLYLPEVNVSLGTRYVGEQAEAYGGALPAIFGAYNAGPHQIDAWKAFPEFGRDALFTERIPFRETREYVKILTRNRAIYEGLYGG